MGRANDHTLLDEIMRHEALPLPLVKQAAREILDLIRDGLISDGVVNVSNFGAFRLKSVAARGGINPHTGERLTIAAHQRVIFTPCKALRELIEPNHQPPIPLNGESPPLPLPMQTAAFTVAPVIQQLEVQQAANSDQVDAVAEVEPSQAAPEEGRGAAPVSEAPPAEARGEELEIDLGRFEPTRPRERRRYLLPGVALIVIVLLLALLLMRMRSEPQDSLSIADNSAPPPATPLLLASDATPPAAEALHVAATSHHIAQGDTLWYLAAHHYHEPLLWPHIFQANRDTIRDPDRLRTGDELIIPALQGPPEALSESDRYQIAEGYYLTYQHYQAKGNSDAFYALLMAKRYDAAVMLRHREQLNLSRVEP